MIPERDFISSCLESLILNSDYVLMFAVSAESPERILLHINTALLDGRSNAP
jgi:hypothetical protein